MLKFKDVSLKYVKDYYALCDIECTFEKGIIYNIVGENASGKSSILRCIAKLENSYTGEISYNDIDIQSYSYEKELAVGYIPQQPVVLENKNVVDNIKYAIKNRQIVSVNEEDYFVNQILKSFELDTVKTQKMKKLDYFTRHKMSFARLSMRNLNILLIDNIFDLLDKNQIEIFVNYINEYFKSQDIIIILASSYPLVDYIPEVKVINISAGIIKGEKEEEISREEMSDNN